MSGQTELARQCAAAMMSNDRASQRLGIVVDIPTAGSAVARMTVTSDMLNGFDICHGGVLFTLADTAFAFACNAYNDLSVAASGSVDYLLPAHAGDELTATATEELRSGRRGYYRVDLCNQEGQLVAVFHGRSAARGEPLLK